MTTSDPRGGAEAHFARAQTLWSEGRLEAAAESLQRGLAIQPQRADAQNNLGLLLHSLGRDAAAVECLRTAIALKPDFAWAHNNLGNVLQALRRPAEAIECYRTAVRHQPDHATAWMNLGNALKIQGDADAAVESLRRAIAIKPDYAIAHQNLADALQVQGDLDAAIASFRKAVSLQPPLFAAQSGMLFAMTVHPTSSPADTYAAAQRFGAAVAAAARPYTRWPEATSAAGGRPLRVGLVSGDLGAHPVGFFIESVLAHLDARRVELLAYATSNRQDELAARIRPRFAKWTSIADLGDEAAAARIHADAIQVLIDLSGHTAHNRLPMMAWRPAPVQVSWLGYFGTTGVPGIDYVLADRVSVPETHVDRFTERIWHLPDTRFCFTQPGESSEYPVAPPPALRNRYVTFASFQPVVRLNDRVLAAWAEILRAVPTARLRLQNAQVDFAAARTRLLGRLQSAGIDPSRVTTAGKQPRDAYLRAHAEGDIVLDTFPYSGATTTCEALWMGVPTLTLEGETFAARQGASLLACVGLGDWIARDVADYVERAVRHAYDVERLAALRAALRARIVGSPLCDAPRFARALAEALAGMWRARS